MADRNFEFGTNYGKGVVYLDFSFATNGASDPATTTWRGASANDVKSVTYAATGKYTITLKDKYRYCITKFADLEDAGTPDGGYASCGAVSNEGSSSTGLSFVVTTFNAGGTATQFTTRRLSVSMSLKNSSVGA